ncbi:ABC transporter substrate-binding protein [Streptomyces spinoverrucosus]|uniref:ABC transporter substrate-binding protein n=1 Tax=Streptomyces spinoverrucosus TaxID=284043 RepID=UPI0018C36044|nr:ABC transporter substrate-binding protein [Streptomyces spinoverrucosus]MBG0851930.1 ABC transporter substrate-binding protein [Streptomyces spinoverrucosus]
MPPIQAARHRSPRGHRPCRPTTAPAVATATLLTLLLTSCGSGTTEIPEDDRAAALGREDVVSAVHEKSAISATLPAKLRESGTLRIGSGIGIPPIAFSPEDGGPPRGVDIDVSEAVARVLGLKVERKHVSGASLITGLNADRYDLGTANLAVTEERKHALDFVLYVTDGTGFAVRDDSELKKVDDLKQLCGLRVGTGTGTTFEADLEVASKECVADDEKPISISTYPDAAAHFLALRQGRVDVLMTTSSVLRFAATQQPDLRYLNEIERKNVGLAVKKGSPLAEPLKGAVNQLIEDGTYAKILKKWGLEPAAIDKSVVNPGARP